MKVRKGLEALEGDRLHGGRGREPRLQDLAAGRLEQHLHDLRWRQAGTEN